MHSTDRYKLGGNLLAGGASLVLLVKVYWLLVPNGDPSSLAYRVMEALFGYWFARLAMPTTSEGIVLEFSWISLVWIPWTAVFIAFLLWIGVKVIKGQFKSDLVPLPVLGIVGVWFFVGLLYDKISSGFNLQFLLSMLPLNLATIAMIVGIGLILFNYKKAMADVVDDVSQGSIAAHVLSKNREGKADNPKTKWAFDWVTALIGAGVAGFLLSVVGKKYIIAGVISGSSSELAVSIGLVIVVMVGIIAGYGVKLIKRK